MKDQEHKTPGWSSSPPDSTSINSLMTLTEIARVLTAHGCIDLTEQLDRTSYGPFARSSGGFGDVFSGKLVDGTQVAIKVFRLQVPQDQRGKELKHAARELYTWSKCQHPNILGLLGLVEFRGQIGMVSPWMENGSISTYLCRQPDANRRQLCYAISKGLAYLHSIGIIHGDLKGANVLISSNGTPLLADFGSSVLSNHSLHFTTTTDKSHCSPRWTAPEVLEGTVSSSYSADVFSLGMTLLETVTGKVPYHELERDQAVYMAIAFKKKIPERPEDLSPDSEPDERLWNLLVQCWTYEPKDRPNAEQVQAALLEVVDVRASRASQGANYPNGSAIQQDNRSYNTLEDQSRDGHFRDGLMHANQFNRPSVLGRKRKSSGGTLEAVVLAPNPGCPTNRSQSLRIRRRWYNVPQEEASARSTERGSDGNSGAYSNAISLTTGRDQFYCFSPGGGTINSPASSAPSSSLAVDAQPPLALIPVSPGIPLVHRSIAYPPPPQHLPYYFPDSAQITITGPTATFTDSLLPLTSCAHHSVQPSNTSIQPARTMIENLSGMVERRGSIDQRLQLTAGSSYLLSPRNRYDFPTSVHPSASAENWVPCIPTTSTTTTSTTTATAIVKTATVTTITTTTTTTTTTTIITEPGLDRESWHTADSRERKLLIIGSSYKEGTFPHATVDTGRTLLGVSHDVRSLSSVFRRRRYAVESLVENAFDAATVLDQIATFLGDAEAGDVRAILFTGHARPNTSNKPAAILLPGYDHKDPQGLITADEWQRTVQANTRPGVIVLSIFASCFSGSFMQQPISVKDLSFPEAGAGTAAITPVTLEAPIFITFASSKEDQWAYESIAGCPCETESKDDDEWRFGDHFLRAFTLAAERHNFNDWKSFIQALNTNLTQLRKIGAFFADDPTWPENHPQEALYTASQSDLPDLDDLMPEDASIIEPPTPALQTIDLSEAFLAHVSLRGETAEITHFTSASAQ